MSIPLLGVGAIIETVGKVVGDLHTSDKERAELELRGRELDQANDMAQIEVNKVEAAHPSLFVAGWRPAFGWAGVFGFLYAVALHPMLTWASTNFSWVAPPELQVDLLWVVVSGLLGLGGLRTYEKLKLPR
jgi:hypothetical protein